ncbi:hypothetical protein ABDD95_00660 [Mucilaginibacter sp. PAMB04274]|uniref:hypothetical protein n=1 Tax=Mucilaginibacter sp. PAMB04274 TaxID=3138568 RepID=UPI0031F5FFA0
MDDVTIEKANYVIAYYSHLLTWQERKALRHHHSTLKLKDVEDRRLTSMHLKAGWLSDDPIILNYLKRGTRSSYLTAQTEF